MQRRFARLKTGTGPIDLLIVLGTEKTILLIGAKRLHEERYGGWSGTGRPNRKRNGLDNQTSARVHADTHTAKRIYVLHPATYKTGIFLFVSRLARDAIASTNDRHANTTFMSQ